ncbi:MAG: VOC family protein [Bacteroidales bacterium]|nr:VOC family protein [Bacteroidales bacterium]
MKINKSNITIHVKDMNESIAFYESIGLTLENRWANHYAQMVAPGITIGLHPGSEHDAEAGSGNVSIGFTTDDFEEAKLLLNRLSIKTTIRQEEGGTFIHFNDPNGTALYLIQTKW